MNKKIPLGSALAFLLIAVTLTFTITMSVSWRMYNRSLETISDTQTTYSKLSEVVQLVRQYYLFDADDEALNDSLISGYIDGLGDNYAKYISAGDVQADSDSYNGKSTGVGVSYIFHPDTGFPYITTVHNNSSAQAAGIQVGDQIVMVNDTDVLTDAGSQLLSSMSGKVGETFTVTVSRDGKYLTYYLKITEYELTTVTQRTIEDVGVVRISGFNTSSVEEFKTAVNSLVESGVTGIVLDLRHNSGGSVPAAKEMLDFLLPEGVLYSAEYADGSVEQFTSDAACVDIPMTVLVDDKTASAAELFAGAIKDFYAGQIIGETTYGKGIMQRTFTLSDGSAVKFTTAYILTPLGTKYHGTGIIPNTTIVMNDNAKSRFYLLSFDEDPQLKAAFTALSAKTYSTDSTSSEAISS